MENHYPRRMFYSRPSSASELLVGALTTNVIFVQRGSRYTLHTMCGLKAGLSLSARRTGASNRRRNQRVSGDHHRKLSTGVCSCSRTRSTTLDLGLEYHCLSASLWPFSDCHGDFKSGVKDFVRAHVSSQCRWWFCVVLEETIRRPVL